MLLASTLSLALAQWPMEVSAAGLVGDSDIVLFGKVVSKQPKQMYPISDGSMNEFCPTTIEVGEQLQGSVATAYVDVWVSCNISAGHYEVGDQVFLAGVPFHDGTPYGRTPTNDPAYAFPADDGAMVPSSYYAFLVAPNDGGVRETRFNQPLCLATRDDGRDVISNMECEGQPDLTKANLAPLVAAALDLNKSTGTGIEAGPTASAPQSDTMDSPRRRVAGSARAGAVDPARIYGLAIALHADQAKPRRAGDPRADGDAAGAKGVAEAKSGASGCAARVRDRLFRARAVYSGERGAVQPVSDIEILVGMMAGGTLVDWPQGDWRERVETELSKLGAGRSKADLEAMACLPAPL